MDATEFLQVFFGTENRITIRALSDGSVGGEHLNWLQAWIDDLSDAIRPSVLLPRLTDGGETIWYALAFDAKQTRALRAELLAFVGPTLTDFDGTPPPQPSDALEEAVATFTGGHYLRLRVPSAETVQERNEKKRAVRDSLTLMRDLRTNRPVRQVGTFRQVGRILRDFEWDLRAADGDRSLARLDELRLSGRVSAINLAYLRIQRYSTLGNHDELIADRDLPEVLQTRRPAMVSEAILAALYAKHFRRLGEEGDAEAALRTFREKVATPFAALFRGRGSLDSEPARVLFMLWACTEPVKRDLFEEILSLRGPHPPLVSSLAEMAQRPASEPQTALMAAQRALDEGAFETALGLLHSAGGKTRQVVELALRCSYELETKDSARFALERLSEIGPDQALDLTNRRSTAAWIRSAERRLALPDSWCGLMSVLNSASPGWEEATQWAKEDWVNWDPREFENRGREMQSLILLERDPEPQAYFRDVLPSIVTALDNLPDGAGNPAVRAVHDGLILDLATRSGLGEAELEGLLDLIRSVLDAGVGGHEYAELVESLLSTWSGHESIRWFSWLLEAGELVSAYPVSDDGAPAAFTAVLDGSCRKFLQSLDRTQLEIARDVLLQLGAAEASTAYLVPAINESHEREGVELAAMHVAVHTLARGVGDRVGRLLREAYPGIVVDVSDDLVGSPRLRDLARNADVFVVATRAAKHAATEFIKQHRPDARATIYSRGKGSSSIIAVLHEWATGSAAAA